MKDDRCKTNVISCEFIERNKNHFNLSDQSIDIEHSNEDYTEATSKVQLNGSVKIG